MTSKRTPLAERLDEIRQRIAAACAKARREPGEVTLVAVTKTAVPEQIREVLQLGVVDLGESRVQVLAQRAGQLNEFLQRRAVYGDGGTYPDKVRWHMLGHLQRNKVKPLMPLVSMIQSVDSLRLAEEIELYGARLDRRMPVLMEVNACEEQQKFGVAVGAAIHLAEQIDQMQHVQLCGLMAMGPLNGTEGHIRAVFSRTRELFEEMKWNKIGGAHMRHLSMGMSGDFEHGIAEGATIVRIGSALFGGTVQDHEESGED